MRNHALSLLIAAGLALGIPAAQAQQTAPAKPGELVVGMTQFPPTLNPHIDSMLAKTYILAFAGRPLSAYDDQWKLVCMLCTELPTIENGLAKVEKQADGTDGVAITYTLNPKATWGDGTPVTTKDVVFTWEVGKHPDTGVANLEQFQNIASIDVKDAKTFTFHKKKLKYSYNVDTDFRLIPEHLDRANFAVPADYKKKTAFDTSPTNPGLYFGPYRVTNFEIGATIVLEPNPTWYGEKPQYKRIVLKLIENTAAMEANLLSGSVDYVSGELGVTIDQAITFQKRFASQYGYNFKPGLLYEHIDLNLDNPLLKDKRVRQALLYALDRGKLTQQLFEGKQPVADTAIHPLDWIYDKQVKAYPYDTKKAAELLDAAGFNVMKEGFRHSAAGDRLRFELMTTAGNRTRELVEQVLQSQWKAVGVEILIKNEPARVYFGETTRMRKYTGMAMYAWISSPENSPRTQFHSSHIPTEANGWAGQNYPGYKNPKMDELIDKLEVELDREKRGKLWAEYQTIYAEELPVLPLYFRADPFIIPKWLTGVVPTGHQYGTSYWAQVWGAS
ncbi:MAG: peptide ABC transporter substrate-binding protein [Proteobacteria bacterium]|nr:peptide ABC transporter substrate-binding protein [Pseudomonadota bacterium]MBI3497297.1 peptide ABC transporter substrate-binding protein [Pseudomonadota bacterium]